jgi:phosphonate C-P lyase system protein PhnG
MIMPTSAAHNLLPNGSIVGRIQEFQALVSKMDIPAVTNLLELLPAKDFILIKQPATALVMLCVKDCFDTDFCLGEALVTEAELEYSGKKGYAMVLGEDPTRALAIASLDAFFQSSDDGHQAEIKHFLALTSEEIIKKEEQERKLAASTRVNFENMVKG